MPRKKNTETKATNPLDVALRESLHRALKKNADKWPKEAPDLLLWIDREKPNFSNLREAFLADKTPEELAELFPNGQKGLDDLLKCHEDAIGAAVDAFPDGYDTEPPPPRLRPRESIYADVCPAMLFSVLPFPAGEVPAKDKGFNNPCFYPTFSANLSFYPVFSSRGPEDYNAPELEDGLPLPTAEAAEKIKAGEPKTDAERLLWTLANGEVVLVPHELFPSKNWLDYITYAWLAEHRERLRTRPLKVPLILVKGGEFASTSKLTAGISWGMAGNAITVNGHEFAQAPDLSPSAEKDRWFAPAGYKLLTKEQLSKPHQTVFALDDEGTPPLPVALAGNGSQTTIAGPATKISLNLLSVRPDIPHTTTVRKLANIINPHAKRIERPHFEAVSNSLKQLDGLYILLPTGMAYPLFSVPLPWRELTVEDFDVEIEMCVSPLFNSLLEDLPKTLGRAFNGEFIYDFTAVMGMAITGPKAHPVGFRQYMRICAFWNQYFKRGSNGVYIDEMIPEVPTREWAAMCNALSPGAVRGDRKKLYDDLDRVITEAEWLEEQGRVRIAKADKRSIRLLATDEWQEAKKQRRSTGMYI